MAVVWRRSFNIWGDEMDTDFANVRPMIAADLENVLAWRNHPDVRRYMYTQHEIAEDEHRRWFERAAQDPDRHLLVFEAAGVAQGFVNFHRVAAGGVADWGFYLAPDVPRGTGHLLGRTALNYAFAEIGLHKVCGQALAYNERSIRFHHKLGFSRKASCVTNISMASAITM